MVVFDLKKKRLNCVRFTRSSLSRAKRLATLTVTPCTQFTSIVDSLKGKLGNKMLIIIVILVIIIILITKIIFLNR